MRQKRSATLSFSAVQASFWMSLCIAISFAAVHLKALGFSNTGLGLTLAAGNILGTLAGPLLASLSEKRRLPTARLIWPLFGLRVLCLIALAFCSEPTLSAAVFYALYVAGMMAVNSLNLKFCVDAELRGLALDYGKARAAGSLAYVLISALLGVLVERRSYPVLIWAAATVLLLQAASTFWIGAELGGEPGAETASEAKTGVSLPALLRGEPRFALFLLGSVLLYFSHNAITNYMINIVRNLGGDTGTMGLVNAVMAMVEIPVMLFFSLLARRLRVSLLLKLSVAAFLAKALAFALAPSIPALYASLLLQAPSFALYTAAVVPYVSRVIAPENAAKAQSLAFSVTTLGAVGASMIAGSLFDRCPVQTTLLIAAAVCALGVCICVPFVQRTDCEQIRNGEGST